MELLIDPRFDIWSAKGKTKVYKGVDVTLGRKNFDGVFHYWWFTRPFGEPHGFVYLTDATNPEMSKLAYIAAKNLIDVKILQTAKQLQKQGGKKI